MDNFLGVTAHYLEVALKQRRSLTLGKKFNRLYLLRVNLSRLCFLPACREFNQRHSAEEISLKIKEILAEYGVLDKCTHLVTDSAKNMERSKFLPNCTLFHLTFIYLAGRIINDVERPQVENLDDGYSDELEDWTEEEMEKLLQVRLLFAE